MVHELIAGGITLFRAAAAFRALSAQGPQPQVPIRIAYPQAASDDEAYCRCVIAYAGTEAPADQSDLLMSKLTAELSDRIRTGTLHIMDAAMDAEQAANAASPPTH
ncbi:MAG TPA: hypothetical protein VMS17_31410 [Gemmataceae bacterium]|nr:hypothetical protein [Gemmataceae bacterium]